MVGRMPERRVDLSGRLARKGPRKLLAIDVGGIRGVLSLKILEEIEQLLIREIKRDAPAQGTTTSVAISPDVDQLQKAINLLTTLLAASTDATAGPGQRRAWRDDRQFAEREENCSRSWRGTDHELARRRHVVAQRRWIGRTVRNDRLIRSGSQPICPASLPCDNRLRCVGQV
jgi:hypothetical protein